MELTATTSLPRPRMDTDRNLLFGVLAPARTVDYGPGRGERYTRTRLHALGGIGQVWFAQDNQLGREVALKELRVEQADNPTVVARFLKEARITGQLEHPGIVPVYEL